MIGLATVAAVAAASLASSEAKADTLFDPTTGTCQSVAGTVAFGVDERYQITDPNQRACDLTNGQLTEPGSCTTPRLSPVPFELSKYAYRIPCNSMDTNEQPTVSSNIPIVILLHGGDGGPNAYTSFMGRNTDLFGADVAVVSLNSETYDDSAAPKRSSWGFPGAEALTVEAQEAYVDVVRLERLIESLKSIPALAESPVVLAAFSHGTHLADQMLCTRSDMIDAVFNITADAFRSAQMGSTAAARNPASASFLHDGCGSGRELGYQELTGRASTVYGKRVADTGALYNPSLHPADTSTVPGLYPVAYYRYFGMGDDNIAFDDRHIGMAETARLLKALNGFAPDRSPTATRFIPGGLTATFGGAGYVTTLTPNQNSLIPLLDTDDLVVTEYRWELSGKRIVFGKAHPSQTMTDSSGIHFSVFNWWTEPGDPVSNQHAPGCGEPLESVFPFTDQSRGQVLPGPATGTPYEKGGAEDCPSVAKHYGLHQWWDGTGISQTDLKATDLILEAL